MIPCRRAEDLETLKLFYCYKRYLNMTIGVVCGNRPISRVVIGQEVDYRA